LQLKNTRANTKRENIVPPVILQKNETFTTESFEKPSKGRSRNLVVDPFDKKKYQSKSDDENAIYNINGLTEKPDYPEGMMAFYQFVGYELSGSNTRRP
jgi:hypothetical protein